jgi:hypothetical protein
VTRERATAADLGAPARPIEVPAWLVDALGVEPSEAAGFATNARGFDGGGGELDARDLRALEELILLNGLDEDSSPFDYDDGDGVFEPWELGFQLWQRGRLIALALGPNPHFSFDYRVGVLPESIADLDALVVLDVHGNRLRALPDGTVLLSALRELRAHDNQLEALPERIGELRQLERLLLARNELERLPESLVELRVLEWLHVADNPLLEVPDGLGEIASLRRLDVSRSERPGASDPGQRPGLDRLPRSLEENEELDLYVAGNQLFCGGGGPAAGATSVYGLGAQRCAGP